jgi:hypothetical protein
LKTKNFLNDKDGITVEDTEKLIMGGLFIMFTTCIAYVYTRFHFIDLTATYLDISLGTLFLLRKISKYTLQGKQITSLEDLKSNLNDTQNTNNQSDQSQG